MSKKPLRIISTTDLTKNVRPILDAVARGEQIVISRYGDPVAILTSFTATDLAVYNGSTSVPGELGAPALGAPDRIPAIPRRSDFPGIFREPSSEDTAQ
jgi:prevent-host-death family protein